MIVVADEVANVQFDVDAIGGPRGEEDDDLFVIAKRIDVHLILRSIVADIAKEPLWIRHVDHLRINEAARHHTHHFASGRQFACCATRCVCVVINATKAGVERLVGRAPNRRLIDTVDGHVLEHFDDVRRLLHPEFIADAVLNVPFRNVVFDITKAFGVGDVIQSIKDTTAGLDLGVVIGVVVSFDHIDGTTGVHVHLADDLRDIVAVPRQCSLHRDFGSNPIRIANFHTILFKQIVQLFGHHVDHFAVLGRGLTGAVVHPVFVPDGDGVERDIAIQTVDQVIDVNKQAINRCFIRQMVASRVGGCRIEMLGRQNPVDCRAFVGSVGDKLFRGDKIIFEIGRIC